MSDDSAVAFDTDPRVLQTIGEGAFGVGDGRLGWVRVDLADPAWPNR
ncbi:hypothetical protein RB614_24320 [Phytohabitans sp. ZYX-F-186]|uniref:Uncharacterized protein n=1 Tax=Phytohabitans maris TaxID=3071409 RepID=A0ABU0ZMK8_9ACTN|nr:hypothetical protein [Phytohabitans sp. ZYX-F-186]MDQ7907652.1 hypothetical protein [Phytohabitans sp. ZYX-F-186]